MKKIFLPLFLVLVLSSCTGVVSEKSSPATDQTREQKFSHKKILLSTDKVFLNMTEQELRETLKDSVKIGYQRTYGGESGTAIISVPNPQSEDKITIKAQAYKVLYYLTQIHNADGEIGADELTPFVFKEDKLIGFGSDFLSNLKKN